MANDHASPDDRLTIGEIIDRTGVSASALHFYERKGLITAERSPGNNRLYPRHMLRRISLILVAKKLGVPLSEVADVFAALPQDSPPSHEQWQRVSRAWKAQLEERRRYIETLERELTGCIGCGCLSMKACALLNPDDDLSDRGKGPVRLNETTSHHGIRRPSPESEATMNNRSPEILRHADLIVDAPWLMARIDEPDLMVLDSTVNHHVVNNAPQWVNGRIAFDSEGHIPRSRFADLLESFAEVEAPLPLTVPSAEQLSRALSSLGITRSTRVVIYDNDGNRWAARLWYLLEAAGHQAIHVLSGGLRAWVDAGGEVVTTAPEASTAGHDPSSYGPVTYRDGAFTDRSQVQAISTGHSPGQLVHALGRASYVGSTEDATRSGHIPGAANLPWESLNNPDGTLIGPEQRSALLERLRQDEQPVVYCGSGISASLVLLALADDGRTGSLYDGSLKDWASHGGELVTGERPR